MWWNERREREREKWPVQPGVLPVQPVDYIGAFRGEAKWRRL